MLCSSIRFLASTTLLFAAGCGSDAITPTGPRHEFARPPHAGGGGGAEDAPSDPGATFVIAPGFGLSPDAPSAVYTEDECGVHAKLFATEEKSNSGDAILHTSNPRYRDRKCPDYPRRLGLDFDADGNPDELVEVFLNVKGVHNTTYEIPVGETHSHVLTIDPVGSVVCEAVLVFDPDVGEAGAGALVHVTRTAADEWRVRSDDPRTVEEEGGRAVCTSTGATHVISVDFTISADRPL